MAVERRVGKITVYSGPMFSGKTGLLVNELTLACIGEFKVQAFKPNIDNRGEGTFCIKDKNNHQFPAKPVEINNPAAILDLLEDGVSVVGIDEIQFFDSRILPTVRKLSEDLGIDVLAAGLPTDFRGEPFGSMPQLLAVAHNVIYRPARCTYRETPASPMCWAPDATQTQRLIDGKPAHWNSPIVLVGGAEKYQVRCRHHHEVPGRPEIYIPGYEMSKRNGKDGQMKLTVNFSD